MALAYTVLVTSDNMLAVPTVVYTCPAGVRILWKSYIVDNYSAFTRTFTFHVNRNGVNRLVTLNPVTLLTLTVAKTVAVNVVLEPGDTIIATASVAGCLSYVLDGVQQV